MSGWLPDTCPPGSYRTRNADTTATCAVHFSPDRPEWRNGRRSGLKIRRGDPWEFESPLRHHHYSVKEHVGKKGQDCATLSDDVPKLQRGPRIDRAAGCR